jgi:hypothetical protein
MDIQAANKIPRALRSRVNEIAHAHALQVELDLRARYAAAIGSAIAAKTPPGELAFLLEQLSAAGPSEMHAPWMRPD